MMFIWAQIGSIIHHVPFRNPAGSTSIAIDLDLSKFSFLLQDRHHNIRTPRVPEDCGVSQRGHARLYGAMVADS